MPKGCAGLPAAITYGRHVLRHVALPMPVKACAPMCTNWCTPREAAEDRPVADRDVAGELACVGEDGVVADLAVVREVHVGHDPVVVAQARHAGVLRRAAVDRDVLADGVAVADLHPRVGSPLYFLSCGGRADRREVEDAVVAADARVAVEHDVRADPGALADLDVRADDRVGPDLDVRARAARPDATIAVGWIRALMRSAGRMRAAG